MTKTTQKCANFVDVNIVLHFQFFFVRYSDLHSTITKLYRYEIWDKFILHWWRRYISMAQYSYPFQPYSTHIQCLGEQKIEEQWLYLKKYWELPHFNLPYFGVWALWSHKYLDIFPGGIFVKML